MKRAAEISKMYLLLACLAVLLIGASFLIVGWMQGYFKP